MVQHLEVLVLELGEGVGGGVGGSVLGDCLWGGGLKSGEQLVGAVDLVLLVEGENVGNGGGQESG